MNGELGVLSIENKQVGGFLDWQMDIDIREVSASLHQEYVVQKWKANARKFWMLEIPSSNIMDAVFYILFHDELLAVSKNRVKVKLPESYKLDEIIEAPLVME